MVAEPGSDLDKILQVTALLRNWQMPYTKDVAMVPGISDFSKDMKKFLECYRVSKELKPQGCNALSNLLRIAEKGTWSDGKQTKQSVRDQDFIEAANKLQDEIKGAELDMLIEKVQK